MNYQVNTSCVRRTAVRSSKTLKNVSRTNVTIPFFIVALRLECNYTITITNASRV